MAIEEKKLGTYRKDVYVLFEKIVGREMTSEEHKQLKEIIVEYVNANSERPIMSEKQKEHIYICGNCGGRVRGKGVKFKRSMNRNYKKEK